MPYEKSLQGLEGEYATTCPDCSSTNLMKRESELYCMKCGYVIE